MSAQRLLTHVHRIFMGARSTHGSTYVCVCCVVVAYAWLYVLFCGRLCYCVLVFCAVCMLFCVVCLLCYFVFCCERILPTRARTSHTHGRTLHSRTYIADSQTHRTLTSVHIHERTFNSRTYTVESRVYIVCVVCVWLCAYARPFVSLCGCLFCCVLACFELCVCYDLACFCFVLLFFVSIHRRPTQVPRILTGVHSTHELTSAVLMLCGCCLCAVVCVVCLLLNCMLVFLCCVCLLFFLVRLLF